jgi:HSP20 family protein
VINPYSPVNELIRLQEDINRLFAELSGHISGGTLQRTTNWIPNIDLSEDSKEFIVRAEVPGVSADDLQIVFQEGYLHIRGEKNDDRT